MAKMMKTAERALHKRTNKMLASATKRYKKFMRQAAKAASDYKREEYLAAALSALVVTGVVASKLMANLEGKKPLPQVLQGKNVRRRQINRHAREDVDELRTSPRSRRRSARYDLFIFDERSKLLRALRATEYEPFAARRTSSRNVVQPHCSAAVGTRRRFTNRLFG